MAAFKYRLSQWNSFACESFISGAVLPDPPSRALAGGEHRFWAGNTNRPLFNYFNLASLGYSC